VGGGCKLATLEGFEPSVSTLKGWRAGLGGPPYPGFTPENPGARKVVRLKGFEPLTRSLEGCRSEMPSSRPSAARLAPLHLAQPQINSPAQDIGPRDPQRCDILA
jgi:hypothetical protein